MFVGDLAFNIECAVHKIKVSIRGCGGDPKYSLLSTQDARYMSKGFDLLPSKCLKNSSRALS